MDYFLIWFSLINFSFFLILFNYLHFANKPDILNNILGFGALFFIFIHIIIFLVLMNRELLLPPIILPLFLLVLIVPIAFLGLLVVISTRFVYVSRKFLKKDFSKLSKTIREKRKHWSKAKKDTYRKLNHVLIFVGLLIVWYLGLFVVYFYTGSSAGMIPKERDMLSVYLRIINESDSIRVIMFSFGWFYYLLFFFFYILSLFMLVNEFTRKSQVFSFPFNLVTKLYLTEEETENYGTYLYFAIGHMFAAFICSSMVFFSIFSLSCEIANACLYIAKLKSFLPISASS